jgi:hypothetical protein
MPLPVDVDTLPLYLWERWRGESFDPAQDLDRLLPLARAGTLVFWWLLLIYGRLTARLFAGPWAGRLAVALLASEPTLLAHASLATTDIAISASLLALSYHFAIGRESGWFRRIGVPTIWFAVAVLAKASGLVFGPLCLVVIELERLARQGVLTSTTSWRGFCTNAWQQLLPLRRDAIRIGCLGMVLVFLYCGSDWKTEASFVDWAKKLPDGPSARAWVWTAEHLRIFSNAGEGLTRQVRHNVKSHGGTYLLGQWHPSAFWYYFPVALTIKLTVPLLLFPLLLLFLRPRALLNWAVLCAALLLVFSLTCRVQIGVRIMLPLVLLAIVGEAAALVRACQEPGWQRGLIGSATILGLAWTMIATLSEQPQWLRYVNPLWGGSENGYRLLSDSNYDWGQGLSELAAWQRQHGPELLDVWYFGSDPALKRPPFREVPFHTLPLKDDAAIVQQLHGRYLAISTTMLFGNPGGLEAHERALHFFRAMQPVARTTTFLIYQVRDVPISASNF